MPADMLVGRRLAIGALRSAVDAALTGAGGVVLLEGEAGMGKTALASDAAAYAKAQGAVAVWAACWEGDGAPGYWPWIQVVRGLERAGEGTGETVLAELTGATEARGGILGDEAAARFRTYDEAATYVRWCAAQRPLVIVLDDLHWADLSSLRLLVFLARQLHDAAALVIGTYRDVDMATGDHLARPLLAELAGQAELLQLTGLTAGEVGRLLDMVCGERPPPALIRAVHDRTGGNPFFAQQIARLLVSRGVRLDSAPVTGVPPAVRDVLVRRLARLPREVVDLLAVAAVAGTRFSIATVAAVAPLTESSRSAVIALLEEALAELGGAAQGDVGALRWLLPTSLARELADGPDRDLSRAAGLANATVVDARAAGDAGPLAYALFALGDVRWQPGTAVERLGIAEELAAAAAAASETELVLEAHLARLAALLELGDPSFAIQLSTFTRLAEQAAIPRYLYLARSRQATGASLTGPRIEGLGDVPVVHLRDEVLP